MEMRRGVDLVKNAMRDFELARKYTDAKEYITASILYRKATEKGAEGSLHAATGRGAHRTNASIEYLAEQTVLPDSIYNDLVSIPDETDRVDGRGAASGVRRG